MPKYAGKETSEEAVQQLRQKLALAKMVSKGSARVHKASDRVTRCSNLIAFVTGWYDEELKLHNRAAMTAAYGLADMGSTVCIINPPDGRVPPHNDPVPTDHPMVHHMYTESDADVIKACQRFDYVISIEADTYERSLKRVKYANMAERFIAMCGTTDMKVSNRLANRTFFLVTTPSFSALKFDKEGYPAVITAPHALDLESNQRLPHNLHVPVIGCYYPNVDRKELAKAVLGIGNPRYFYTSKSEALLTTPLALAPKAFTLTGQALLSMATFIGFANSAVAGSALLATALGFTTMTAVREFAPRKLVFSSKNQDKPIDDLYPAQEKAHVKYAVSAPPLGLTADEAGVQSLHQLSTAMYMGDLVWSKTCERYDGIIQRFQAYELDITKMLDAPLMVDYSCPSTASFIQTMHKAQDLRTAVEEARSQKDGHLAVTRGLFAEAVSAMEIAFEVAEKHAVKEGIRGFAEADRKKIALSKKLFKIAQNAGSSDHERLEALKRARRELEGVLVVPDAAIEQIEAGGARPALPASNN